MTWERLLQKKEQFCQIREYIPKEVERVFDKSSDVEYPTTLLPSKAIR